MARAASFVAVSTRLIRSMHAYRRVQSVVIIDRNSRDACPWFSASRFPRMLFQRHHAFGTLTSSPPSSMVMSALILRAILYQFPPRNMLINCKRPATGIWTSGIESIPEIRNLKSYRECLTSLTWHLGWVSSRTRQEFDEGHAAGAVNIPYLILTQQGMYKNPLFLEEVASAFGGDEKIVVGCRSGKRSLMAVQDLRSAGFSKGTNIEGGYMEWPDKECT